MLRYVRNEGNGTGAFSLVVELLGYILCIKDNFSAMRWCFALASGEHLTFKLTLKLLVGLQCIIIITTATVGVERLTWALYQTLESVEDLFLDINFFKNVIFDILDQQACFLTT